MRNPYNYCVVCETSDSQLRVRNVNVLAYSIPFQIAASTVHSLNINNQNPARFYRVVKTDKLKEAYPLIKPLLYSKLDKLDKFINFTLTLLKRLRLV